MRRSINESLENHKVFVMWIGMMSRNLYTTLLTSILNGHPYYTQVTELKYIFI